jgi:hypothetical protein
MSGCVNVLQDADRHLNVNLRAGQLGVFRASAG